MTQTVPSDEQRVSEMDKAWKLLQRAGGPPPMPRSPVVPPIPPPQPTPSVYNSPLPPLHVHNPSLLRHILVTHASKPDHSKVIAMEGNTKGPNWTLPNEVAESVIQIIATLGISVNDLRDEA